MACPCPTSSIQIRAWPTGTCTRGGGHNKGVSNSNGSQSGRNTAGNSSSHTATAASTSIHGAGSAACQAGQPSTMVSSSCHRPCNESAASCNSGDDSAGQGNSSKPDSTNGNTQKLTKGTATALASGPTQLTGRPVASSRGT